MRTEHESTDRLPVYHRPSGLFVMAVLLQFGTWCVVDVLWVRFDARHFEGLVFMSPIVSLFVVTSLLDGPTLAARVVRGLLLSAGATVVAVVVILTLGTLFHFMIGGTK